VKFYNNYPNQIKQGMKAEDTFKAVAEKLGHVVIQATLADDKYSHIDCYVNGSAFDVKSAKSLGFIVETINNWGYPGWIYGQSNYIAVVYNTYIKIYSRKAILELVQSKIIDKTIYQSSEPNKVFYRLYTRFKQYGWRDNFILVDPLDLYKLELRTWII